MSKVPELNLDRRREHTRMRFRSTGDYVEMAMIRTDTTAEERNFLPPSITGSPDVAIRVHRTLLTSALADPEISKNLAPVFGRLLKARIGESAAKAIEGSKPAEDSTNLSIGLDWLTLDYKDSSQ